MYIPSYIFGPKCPICNTLTHNGHPECILALNYNCSKCGYSADHNFSPLSPTHYMKGKQISKEDIEKYKLVM